MRSLGEKVYLDERLLNLENKMNRVVSAWIAGALTDREFTDTLLLFAAMVEEPREIGLDLFEEKIDGAIRKAIECVKDGSLWHLGYSKSTKQSLARVFG